MHRSIAVAGQVEANPLDAHIQQSLNKLFQHWHTKSV
jgi:hypothetical protein